MRIRRRRRAATCTQRLASTPAAQLEGGGRRRACQRGERRWAAERVCHLSSGPAAAQAVDVSRGSAWRRGRRRRSRRAGLGHRVHSTPPRESAGHALGGAEARGCAAARAACVWRAKNLGRRVRHHCRVTWGLRTTRPPVVHILVVVNRTGVVQGVLFVAPAASWWACGVWRTDKHRERGREREGEGEKEDCAAQEDGSLFLHPDVMSPRLSGGRGAGGGERAGMAGCVDWRR